MKLKVLVIGGNGFVGRNLITSGIFKSDDHVVNLVRTPTPEGQYLNNFKTTHLQNLDLDVVGKFDLIINLAQHRNAQSHEESMLFNYELPYRIIKSRSHNNTRVINLATYIQYLNVPEDTRLHSYKIAKKRLSDELSKLHEKKKIVFYDLTLFTLYGIGDSNLTMMSQFIKAIRLGENFPMSPGEQLISWTSVNDIVSIISKIRNDKIAPGAFRCWPEPPTTLKESFAQIEDALGIKPEISWGARMYSGHEMFVYDKGIFPQPFEAISWTPLSVGILQLFNAKSMEKLA